jgi:hypothetical protein
MTNKAKEDLADISLSDNTKGRNLQKKKKKTTCMNNNPRDAKIEF